MNLTAASLLVAALCAPVAHAADVDCRTAKRPVERTLCGSPQLTAADELMGQAYRGALAKVSRQAVGIMRADQVQWLAWMQQVCLPTAKSTRQSAACMLPLYRERTRLLRTAIAQHAAITFYTRSRYFAAPDNRPEFSTYGNYPAMGTLQAQWPQADSAQPEWQAWNQQLEQRALQVASDGQDDTDGQNPPRRPAWGERLAMRRNAEMTARLRHVEHGRVSTWLSSETMGIPAAHPGNSFGSDLWLLQEQRPLEARDVFAPGDQWKTVLGAAAYSALKSGNAKEYLFAEVTGPQAKSLQDVVTEVRNWTLEANGLHISYPDYAVAPRMARPDDTLVPWAALQSILVPGFKQP